MSVSLSLIVIAGGTYYANLFPQLSPQIVLFTGIIVFLIQKRALNASNSNLQNEKLAHTKKTQTLEKEIVDLKKSKDTVERQLKMMKGDIDLTGAEEALLESLYKQVSRSKTRLKKELDKRQMDARTCIICFENTKNTVLIPCGHYMTCHICSETLKDCPVCRKKIQSKVKTFQ